MALKAYILSIKIHKYNFSLIFEFNINIFYIFAWILLVRTKNAKRIFKCTITKTNLVIFMENFAKKRGGRRPGAGRKKSTVKRYGFNAPAAVHAVLQQVDSITEFICEAVLKHGQDKGLC